MNWKNSIMPKHHSIKSIEQKRRKNKMTTSSSSSHHGSVMQCFGYICSPSLFLSLSSSFPHLALPLLFYSLPFFLSFQIQTKWYSRVMDWCCGKSVDTIKLTSSPFEPCNFHYVHIVIWVVPFPIIPSLHPVLTTNNTLIALVHHSNLIMKSVMSSM